MENNAKPKIAGLILPKNEVFNNSKSSLITEPEVAVRVLTKGQLSKYLQISISFIDKLIAEEGLPHFKIGRAIRFNIDEITAFLDRRKRP